MVPLECRAVGSPAIVMITRFAKQSQIAAPPFAAPSPLIQLHVSCVAPFSSASYVWNRVLVR